jgi:hypothetical protein
MWYLNFVHNILSDVTDYTEDLIFIYLVHNVLHDVNNYIKNLKFI